jgi:hypothetical protein
VQTLATFLFRVKAGNLPARGMPFANPTKGFVPIACKRVAYEEKESTGGPQPFAHNLSNS